MSKTVYAIATLDTKEDEIQFVADRIREYGVDVKIVDVSTLKSPKQAADISIESVDASLDRGTAVQNAADGLQAYFERLITNDDSQIGGVIGIGGSGGTAIITQLMRFLPIGLPKLMVSTMASGNIAAYIDCSDIMMMYSVVDVAGLNPVLRQVLGNAAAAMAGMVNAAQPTPDPAADSNRPVVGLTMFGVTTQCVMAIRDRLEQRGFECMIFHATGSGGRAMEKLVASGFIHGVLDITTTEVADEVVGGTMPAGPDRIKTIVDHKLPYLVSAGAVDMVNFGGMETVPGEFKHRQLHLHNEHVTLMRTTLSENQAIAQWIVDRLNKSTSPVKVVLPMRGVSMLDAPGQPFFDPEASDAFSEVFRTNLLQTDDRQVIEVPHHINDPQFADIVVEEFCELWP